MENSNMNQVPVNVQNVGASMPAQTQGGVTKDTGAVKEVNKNLFVWVFCFLLGGVGVDRFMRGQVGAGVCKILFGWATFGIWALVDWITAMTKAYGAYKDVDMVYFDAQGKYTR